MEIAYLALGSDYRFASAEMCRQSIRHYKRVLADFDNLPSICAKANWYIGWILADLLQRPREAIAFYQVIATDYPATTMNLEPPVPWVSLVLPQSDDKPREVYERPSYYWASLALLEIIRLSENNDERWTAFTALWSNYRNSLATGYAMRELLNGPRSVALKAASYARAHLDAHNFSGSIDQEIRAALSKLSGQASSSAEHPGRGEK